MGFNKEEYWKRRNNVEEIKDDDGKVIETVKKPLRGQGDKPKKSEVVPTGDAEISFIGGQMVFKNRAYRRRRLVNKLLRKKGYNESLHALRITRKKNGKTKKKYVFLSTSGV